MTMKVSIKNEEQEGAAYATAVDVDGNRHATLQPQEATEVYLNSATAVTLTEVAAEPKKEESGAAGEGAGEQAGAGTGEGEEKKPDESGT